MTLEDQQNSVPGFSRRTALKAAAWSVPVIAVASAVPAAAASVEGVDLRIEWEFGAGESRTAFSPDGSRQYSISVPSFALVTNGGSADVAAGSLLTATFDARLYSAMDVYVGDAPLESTGATTSGNTVTASFLLPALAAGAPAVRLAPRLTRASEQLPWAEDIESYTLTVTSATATDTVPSNNTVVAEARYEDVADVEMTAATWGTKTVPNAQGGAAFIVDVPETFTITALSGATVSEVTMILGIPSIDGSASGPLFESRTITSALLDGTDVRDKITQPHSDAPYVSVLEGISFAPGQKLEVALDVTLTSTAVEGVTNGGGSTVSVSVPGDSSDANSNNTAFSPNHPGR